MFRYCGLQDSIIKLRQFAVHGVHIYPKSTDYCRTSGTQNIGSVNQDKILPALQILTSYILNEGQKSHEKKNEVRGKTAQFHLGNKCLSAGFLWISLQIL